MNIKALQCFIKVYERKSITAAAKEVFISPQGLSKIIKQLEFDMEAELFFRGSQGMEATESGELLYARARHICYLMEDLKKEIRIINGNKSALNVIVTYSAALVVPLDMLFGFSEMNPNLQVKIREYPDEYPIPDLFQEEADIGIMIGHEGIENCKYDVVRSGEIVLAVPSGHSLADKKKISLQELDQLALIVKSVESDKDHVLLEKCHDAGIQPRILFQSGNIQSLHSLCEQQGVPAVTVDFIEKAIGNEGLKIVRFKEKFPQNIYLVSRKRESQNRAVSLFHDYVLENTGKRLK